MNETTPGQGVPPTMPQQASAQGAPMGAPAGAPAPTPAPTSAPQYQYAQGAPQPGPIQQPAPSRGGGMLLVARVLLIIAAVVLVACFFLPYAAGTDEVREAASEFTSMEITDIPATGLEDYVGDMTVGDIVDLSLMDFARMFMSEGSPEMTFAAVIVALPAIASVLVLVLALFGKPIGAVVFAAMTLAANSFVHSLVDEAGLLNGELYTQGIAATLYPAAAVVAIGLCAWLFMLKRQARRAA